jgi:hypothetical protein
MVIWMRRAVIVLFLAVLAPSVRSVSVVASQAPEASGQVCVINGDKVASPVRVLLGETAQIRLMLDPECPPAVYRKADIVLVIDRSLSMSEDNKMTAAKAAARAFVDTTDLGLHRIGLVSFASDVFVSPIGLSADRAKILQAIDDIEIRPGTNIASAIDSAQDLLDSDGRAEAISVLILLSDGSPNAPSPDPRAAAVVSANFSKLAGTTIFSIGFGSDADEDLMGSLSSGSQNYYYAPGADGLKAIYEQIAVVVGTSVVRDVVLVDDLSADVNFVAGSAVPTAEVGGKRLTWKAGLLPSDGLAWVYEVLPTRVGTYPTNDRAAATFTNADGSAGQFVFPVPQITVVDPNESKTCTDPDSWTVMVHAFPDFVGVSAVNYIGCNNRFDSGDWFGGTYPRLPSLEFQLVESATGKVLATGNAQSAPGRVDQRVNLRACQPPPYKLRLASADLGGYDLCPNSPGERTITARDFKRSGAYKSTEKRFGFVR